MLWHKVTADSLTYCSTEFLTMYNGVKSNRSLRCRHSSLKSLLKICDVSFLHSSTTCKKEMHQRLSTIGAWPLVFLKILASIFRVTWSVRKPKQAKIASDCFGHFIHLTGKTANLLSLFSPRLINAQFYCDYQCCTSDTVR